MIIIIYDQQLIHIIISFIDSVHVHFSFREFLYTLSIMTKQIDFSKSMISIVNINKELMNLLNIQ